MLAADANSPGVKYLAVLAFIMSPKAMSSFTVDLVCLCALVHVCVFVNHNTNLDPMPALPLVKHSALKPH